MTKNDISRELAERTGLNLDQSNTVINVVFDIITSALSKARPVYLRGFCTFKVVQRAARKGRDIKRGKIIPVPARKVLKVLPGKQLKKEINS